MCLESIVYKNLIRECRRYMKGMRPSTWLWQTNAMSVIHYIKKLKELKTKGRN